MTTIREKAHSCEFLLSESAGTRSRANITIQGGAGIVEVGTVLGKISASGKYKPSPATATDGTQAAAVINLYRVDATSDVQASAIVRDAEIRRNSLTYHKSVDDAAKKQTKHDQLAAHGIIVR